MIEKSHIKLDDSISKVCDRAVVISGNSRSGTTIVGKLLHSFQNVEYSFEPPALFSLFALIDRLDEHSWRLLYETYLYEEFFINSLCGRAINCNRADDSSVFQVKSREEIEARLAASVGKKDAERLVRGHTLAYKIPSITGFLPRLQRYYPGTRTVIMRRNPLETFHSLKAKAWFNDDTLRNENAVWPNTFKDGRRIPFWVRPEDHDRWLSMDELHRIAYYYLKVNDEIAALRPTLLIQYERFVAAPRATAECLAQTLGLEFGPLTPVILDTVKAPRREYDPGLLNGLEPEIRDRVLAYSDS
ncbi:MAG TPA: sulfotransferase [Desulfovibrio sp.]|uniref:sulfotransferase n=1 Tax=Desulfovibrio sp. TaxID=885 RepID=UPI002C467175|nr:sulfotransferase [Desulfovibrio sp.]HMM39182.1 sulfotransferase [Desulfovibrio sp.]